LEGGGTANIIDKFGGVLVCSLTFPRPCPGVKLQKNIAAGTVYAGFVTMGGDCGDKDPQVFRDNVAHSINGGLNGMGALVFPDHSKSTHVSTCYEASHFTAYKCRRMAILGVWPTKKVHFKLITSIDNAEGISVQVANRDEYSPFGAMFTDSKIWGDIPVPPDCAPDKSYCVKIKKFAWLTTLATEVKTTGREPHPGMGNLKVPNYKKPNEASWEGYAHFKNLHFKGYNSLTA